MSSVFPPVIGGNAVLKVLLGKEFPEAPTMESFTDDDKLRGFPSEVPSPPVLPCKNLVFIRAKIKAPAEFLLHVSIKAQSSAESGFISCVPSYSSLCVHPHGHGVK